MPLTPLSGSSTTPSTPTNVPTNIPNTQSDIIPNLPFITNSEFNKYSIDSSQYPNVTKQLLGFMKGKRILVTYYRLLNNNANHNRSNIADLPVMRNAIDTEYQKILNLELTLPKAFEFTPSTSQANMTITGQVMFYPGMNPNVGDIFLTGVGDGRIGLCRISSVTPGSWRDSRIYTADFLVQEFLDETLQASLEASVTQTVVFSKENYLGGTASLLSEESYLQLQQIGAIRTNLCLFYHQTFFDSNLCSYIKPDGSYDPWVTRFMTNKLSMSDLLIRPKNLFNQNDLYKRTLWSRLEDRYNTTLFGIYGYSNLTAYRNTRMGVFVSELYGRMIVMPSNDPESADPYIFSANFYNGTSVGMTADELLIYTALSDRTSGDLGTLINSYLKPVFTLSQDDQFYKIPLYIHLIDMAMQTQYREIDAPSMNYASTPVGA